MKRAVFCSLLATALLVGLAFRVARLDLRPMHHDEANQAVKFGTLLETGLYRYDPDDHHGPTLYYFTLPSAWIRGQHTLASLDETTLRVVPAIFGGGLILLFGLLAGGLGRTAAATSALLAAVSPALTYYGRFYIQESLFVFFALGFVIALGRCAQRPGLASALWAGLFAGLAVATKETWIIVLASALAASALARATISTKPGTPGAGRPHLAGGLALALAVAALLYSSFCANPSGVLDWLRAIPGYLTRGLDGATHEEAWSYYLRLLSLSRSGGLVWTEGLVMVLSLAGITFAFARRDAGFWPRYISLYSLIALVVFSLLPYKTPWNLLTFYVGFLVLAGVGADRLFQIARPRAARVLLPVLLLAATCQLGAQDWRANFRYPADPRNPYAYAQTSPDFLHLVTRVSDIAALHPARARMLVKVIAGPYEQWPLPWYLRGMTRVGYWTRAAGAAAAEDPPVIVASQDNATTLDASLGSRYVSEYYGLRPGVLLTLYVERGLWERFLASRRAPGSGGR